LAEPLPHLRRVRHRVFEKIDLVSDGSRQSTPESFQLWRVQAAIEVETNVVTLQPVEWWCAHSHFHLHRIETVGDRLTSGDEPMILRDDQSVEEAATRGPRLPIESRQPERASRERSALAAAQ